MRIILKYVPPCSLSKKGSLPRHAADGEKGDEHYFLLPMHVLVHKFSSVFALIFSIVIHTYTKMEAFCLDCLAKLFGFTWTPLHAAHIL